VPRTIHFPTFVKTKLVTLLAAALATFTSCSQAAEKMTAKSVTAADQPAPGLERAVIGGGCFWCIEAIFQRVPGVKQAVSGYAGGHTENPTYEDVCSHTTGHAEVVLIDFDPKVVTYDHLLDVFWHAHDPTTLNRQGHDVGDSYRSIILTLNDAQKTAAEKSKAEQQKEWKDPIVTQIVPLKVFYTAEVSHQDYYRLNGNRNPYCQAVIRPKVEKLESKGIIPKE
jgi:peptide-methionine (S)-S-oxide reductase